MFTTVADQEPKEYMNVEQSVGHLLIVRPLKFQDGFITEFRPEGTDVVFCDVADLDVLDENSGQPGKVYRGNSFLQGYLKGTFKRYIGHTLLGMIYLGPRQKGQKAPYMWQDLSADAAVAARGMAWMQQHQDFLVAITPAAEPADVGPPKYTPPAAPAAATVYAQPDPHAAPPVSTLEQMRRMAQQQPGEAAPF